MTRPFRPSSTLLSSAAATLGPSQATRGSYVNLNLEPSWSPPGGTDGDVNIIRVLIITGVTFIGVSIIVAVFFFWRRIKARTRIPVNVIYLAGDPPRIPIPLSPPIIPQSTPLRLRASGSASATLRDAEQPDTLPPYDAKDTPPTYKELQEGTTQGAAVTSEDDDPSAQTPGTHLTSEATASGPSPTASMHTRAISATTVATGTPLT